MAYYQAKERCYIADRLYEAGATIEHEFAKGKHPPHLVPIKKPVEEGEAAPEQPGADGG